MKHVHTVDETFSTQDDARDLAARGAPDGTAVLARRQTSARGRRGRAWITVPDRSVALSYLHRTHLPPDRLQGLTLDAAVGVATAIEDLTGAEVALKWPNDLLVDGLKVGGLLTELHTDLDPSGGAVVVVGVGVNVRGRRDDLPDDIRGLATTLEAATRRDLDPEALGLLVLRRLREKLAGFEAAGGPDLAAYLARFPYRGARVEVGDGGDVRRGTIDGLAPDGALLVQMDGSPLAEPVASGEVRVVAP